MTAFPHCKINIGLNILAKRNDGFHDLATIFYPIPLCDVLELIRSESQTPCQLSFSGIDVPADGRPNLIERAYALINAEYDLPSIKMHLHKTIPTGAGLGGGSSDAAFALRLLRDKFLLDISADKMAALALKLGSDCPYFLHDEPMYATGRGEQLSPVSLRLTGWQLLIVNPGIHMSTAEAFAAIIPGEAKTLLIEAITQPVAAWQGLITNDFERPVADKYPAIAELILQFKRAGATYTSMTGTGSTVYGLFPPDATVEVSFPAHYFQCLLILE